MTPIFWVHFFFPPPTAIHQRTSVSTGLPRVNDTLSFILFYAFSSPLLLLAHPWVVINLLHKFMSHFLFVLLGCRSKIKPDKYTKWTLRAAAINPPPYTLTFLYLCFMKCWLIPQIFLYNSDSSCSDTHVTICWLSWFDVVNRNVFCPLNWDAVHVLGNR